MRFYWIDKFSAACAVPARGWIFGQHQSRPMWIWLVACGPPRRARARTHPKIDSNVSQQSSYVFAMYAYTYTGTHKSDKNVAAAAQARTITILCRPISRLSVADRILIGIPNSTSPAECQRARAPRTSAKSKFSAALVCGVSDYMAPLYERSPLSEELEKNPGNCCKSLWVMSGRRLLA